MSCGGRRSEGHGFDGRAEGHRCEQGVEVQVQLSGLISGLGARLVFVSDCLDVFVCLGLNLVWVMDGLFGRLSPCLGLVWSCVGTCVREFSFGPLTLNQGLGWFNLRIGCLVYPVHLGWLRICILDFDRVFFPHMI